MKISILGMGYVGRVTGTCWANNGHNITGINIDKLKVGMIN
jgi:UDP-glucose 6-dehydrogenase